MMKGDMLHKTISFENGLGGCYRPIIAKSNDLPSLTNVRVEAPYFATNTSFCALKNRGAEVNFPRSRHHESWNRAPQYRLATRRTWLRITMAVRSNGPNLYRCQFGNFYDVQVRNRLQP